MEKLLFSSGLGFRDCSNKHSKCTVQGSKILNLPSRHSYLY